MLRICFLRKNKTLRALLLSKTALAQIEVAKSLQAELLQAQKNEVPTVSEKDVISERIEAALNKCELSPSRAVQIPVDQFLKYVSYTISLNGFIESCFYLTLLLPPNLQTHNGAGRERHLIPSKHYAPL